MVIGNTILSEYDEVLKREGPAFGLTVTMVDQFLDALCVEAEAFQTSAFWKPFLPVPDPDYTVRAWRGVVTYLLRQPDFLYE